MATGSHGYDLDRMLSTRIAAARTPQSLTAPTTAPKRPVRTLAGEEVTPAELHVAAAGSRLGDRLGLRITVDGFAVWRSYVVLRAGWRLSRVLRR